MDGLATGRKGKGEEEEENDEKELDPFVAAMPKDLTLEDCIIDKAKHKTIEEQRSYYSKKMREMARSDRDEEDGWEVCGKTSSPVVESDGQLDIFQRTVEWSSTKQMRTSLETDLSVEEIFASLVHEWMDVSTNTLLQHAKAQEMSKSAQGAAATNSYPFVTN